MSAKKAKKPDYAIIYMRPDGWWEGGRGFKTRQEALDAATDHNWGSNDLWGIIPTDTLPDILCEEARDV